MADQADKKSDEAGKTGMNAAPAEDKKGGKGSVFPEIFMKVEKINTDPKGIKTMANYMVTSVTRMCLTKVDGAGNETIVMGYLDDHELSELIAKRHELTDAISLEQMTAIVDKTSGAGFIIGDAIYVTDRVAGEKILKNMLSADLAPREKEIMEKRIP